MSSTIIKNGLTEGAGESTEKGQQKRGQILKTIGNVPTSNNIAPGRERTVLKDRLAMMETEPSSSGTGGTQFPEEDPDQWTLIHRNDLTSLQAYKLSATVGWGVIGFFAGFFLVRYAKNWWSGPAAASTAEAVADYAELGEAIASGLK